MASINVFFPKGVLPALGFWAGIIAVIITAMSDYDGTHLREQQTLSLRPCGCQLGADDQISGLHFGTMYASSHPRAKKKNDALCRCIVLYIYTLISAHAFCIFYKERNNGLAADIGNTQMLFWLPIKHTASLLVGVSNVLKLQEKYKPYILVFGSHWHRQPNLP